MGSKKDDSGRRTAGRAHAPRTGYQSPRRPKLRQPASRPEQRQPEARQPDLRQVAACPPPLPVDEADFAEFAAEDGLRMLAALEAMPSLEPNFADDLTDEAAVTIVEIAPGRSGSRAGKAAPRSLRARLGEMVPPSDVIEDGEAVLPGPIEEAVVEIVEFPTDERAFGRDSDNPSTRRARCRPRR